MIVWVSIVWKQEEQFTASVSCTSSHDSSNYHHSGGFVPPDGGSLECRQIIRDRWQNTRVPSLIISTPFIQFSLQSRPNHNSPEAPCSSPAEQSLPTLPPARPQSRRAAAAARGQSSSAPQCRAPREQPDGTENTCAEKSALKWSWRSSSYRNVFMGKRKMSDEENWPNEFGDTIIRPKKRKQSKKKGVWPWDVGKSAGAAAPSPRCSLVRCEAPLQPASHKVHMSAVLVHACAVCVDQ